MKFYIYFCMFTSALLSVHAQSSYTLDLSGVDPNDCSSFEFSPNGINISHGSPEVQNGDLLLEFNNDDGEGIWMNFSFNPDHEYRIQLEYFIPDIPNSLSQFAQTRVSLSNDLFHNPAFFNSRCSLDRNPFDNGISRQIVIDEFEDSSFFSYTVDLEFIPNNNYNQASITVERNGFVSSNFIGRILVRSFNIQDLGPIVEPIVCDVTLNQASTEEFLKRSSVTMEPGFIGMNGFLATSSTSCSSNNARIAGKSILEPSKLEQIKNESIRKESISVYPNPISSGFINFPYSLTNIQLFDSKGLLIDIFDIASIINIDKYSSGLYLVKSDQGTTRFVVKK